VLAAAVVMVGYAREPLVLVRRALQGWAVVVAALSVLLVGVTVRAWSQFRTVAARLAHGLVAATAAPFVVFLASWRLLG
jgi:hypothetical protein